MWQSRRSDERTAGRAGRAGGPDEQEGTLDLEITVSPGFEAWLAKETIAALIERVDAALYRAKKEGRDRLVLAAWPLGPRL